MFTVKRFLGGLVLSAGLALGTHAQSTGSTYQPVGSVGAGVAGSTGGTVSASTGSFSSLASGSVVYASNGGLLKTDSFLTYTPTSMGLGTLSTSATLNVTGTNAFGTYGGGGNAYSTIGTSGIGVTTLRNFGSGQFQFQDLTGVVVARIYTGASGSFSGMGIGYAIGSQQRNLNLMVSGTAAIYNGSLSINMLSGTNPLSATVGVALEVNGVTSATTISTTALNAFNVSFTNIALNSNTLLAGQNLYARSSGGGLVVDGAAGYQYDFATDQSIFSSTDLPVSTTPSATVHVSGTLLGTGAVSFTNPSVAFTRIPAGAGLDYLCGNTTTSLTTFSATTCTVSKREYKRDIVPMRNALGLVMQLKPRNFYFKSESYGPTRLMQYGLIVDEVEKVLPSLVGNESSSVDYAKLSAVNTGAIQEQQAEINELRAHLGLAPVHTTFGKRLKWLFSGR